MDNEIKNYCHIVLADSIFNSEKELLEKKWKEIRENIENKVV